jgi:hypothetical protein
MERAKFENSHCYSTQAPTVSKPKMESMVSYDENLYIIYHWKEHDEENTKRRRNHEMVERFGRKLKGKFSIQK